MWIKRILFISILFLAIILRFYQLGQNPPSLTWDEVSWGYNAYALGLDGHDEFGKFLPIDYLESFGDFKPPMYAYLDIIPIKVLGLTAFATRFPSALLGVFSVVLTYFLTKEIFAKAKYRDYVGLVAMLVLAISPWHIMLSRAAFEANIATFFLITGVWLFLKAINKNTWWLSGSATAFVFSLYTFNSARVVAPILVIILGILYWRKLWQCKKQTIIAGIIGILLIAPIAKFLISPQASLRFKEVNIFSDGDIVKMSNQEIANDNNAVWSKIIHNRRWLYTQSFLKHYFDNLDPHFLFITGDGNPKFSTQDIGEMYLWDLPFFIIGLFLLFKKREDNWKIIPIWLLVGIIPAATARETPHALRIEATLPTFQILVAYGFIQVVSYIKHVISHLWVKRIIYIGIACILLGNMVYFIHGYYANYAKEFSGEWQYGYADAIAYASSHIGTYNTIYMTDALGRPYIYYLFYTKTSPQTFRKEAIVTRDAFGFVTVEQFGPYHFLKDLSSIHSSNKSLFIDIPSHVPTNAHIQKTFPLLNGNPVLIAYTL